MRIGRVSIPGVRYFVTACVAQRRPLFADNRNAGSVCAAVSNLVQAGDVSWLVGTVMPDHVHILFELGDRLCLSRVIAKLKGRTTRAVPHSGILWQENVFEHRLRPNEDAEAYAFYIFMNPYHAGVARIIEAWRWWICTDPSRFRFMEYLNTNGSPQADWLAQLPSVAGQLALGNERL